MRGDSRAATAAAPRLLTSPRRLHLFIPLHRYLLCERLEAVYARRERRGLAEGRCHCLLVVGVEGTDARACSSNRRGGEPRLLLKDPSCEAVGRCLEASFEAKEQVGPGVSRVQLTLFHSNGRAVESRFRVKASARFALAESGVAGQPQQDQEQSISLEDCDPLI